MLKPEDLKAALSNASKHLQIGDSLEALLFDLRKRGADKIDSIKILSGAMGIRVPQAKSLVDRSHTWRDRYAHDQAFHQMTREVFLKLSGEGSDPEITVEERSPDPIGDKQ